MPILEVSLAPSLILADFSGDDGCRAQSRAMIARIHRKTSQPAATNNILTIKRRPYHDTGASVRRCARSEISSLVVCGDSVPIVFLTARGGAVEAVVMVLLIQDDSDVARVNSNFGNASQSQVFSKPA
jgi:hypothetical protein